MQKKRNSFKIWIYNTYKSTIYINQCTSVASLLNKAYSLHFNVHKWQNFNINLLETENCNICLFNFFGWNYKLVVHWMRLNWAIQSG